MRLMRLSLEPPAQGVDPELFARFIFGPATTLGPRDFHIPLQSLGNDPRAEIWRCPGPNQTGTTEDGIRHVRNDDYLLMGLQCSDPGHRLRHASFDAYCQLLDHASQLGYPHIVKAWNYLARINAGDGDQERYRQFCLGRGESFAERLPSGHPIPAGTAIGTLPGADFTVILLAARVAATAVENPRQLSAYRYPREYGPKSPSFSRAALMNNASFAQLFISGTAAIVGHRSRHTNDPDAQLDETLNNLETLFEAARRTGQLARTPALAGDSRLRVYLRDPALAETARRRLAPLLADPGHLILLHGDICRAELQVEIDGVITL